ncbi:MAG: helix-turn-helix domain-containing protein [Clostridia bacterium]|nr:helix-turn-helix domain-containing protein [Clostridia bacterium]
MEIIHQANCFDKCRKRGICVQASGKEASFIESRTFRRLFFSYLAVILVFLSVYAIWYFQSYNSNNERILREKAAQQVQQLETVMDQQMITAQSLCNSINTSETCRTILQAYMGHTQIDSLQLYRILGELSRIKGASSNMNVYTVMLGFQGDNRLFLPGTVTYLDSSIELLERAPMLMVTSVNELLNTKEQTAIVLDKTYLIYGDNYTSGTVGSAKGVILVLLEVNSLEKMLTEYLAGAAGFEIVSGKRQLFCSGECEGEMFEAPSLARQNLTYRLYLPESHFKAAMVLTAMLPLFLVLILGLLFVGITYGLSIRYSTPIFSIGQMVEAWRGKEGNADEMEQIYASISSLIGERNGYREQVVTMSPYARQGALHQLISEQKEVSLDIDPAFHHAFLVPAVLNIQTEEGGEARYSDIHALLREICRQMSNESHVLFVHVKQLNQVYVLLSSDDEEGSGVIYQKLFRKLGEAVDDANTHLTLGVGTTASSIQGLRDAMEDADHALSQIVTGGRGSVFFFEELTELSGCRYPHDAAEQLTKALKSGDAAEVDRFLNALYEENLKRRDPSPAAVIQLVEDLHLSVRSALRTVSSLSTTTMRIERMEMPFTAEEAFEYYRRVLCQAQALYADNTDTAGETDVEESVCTYINAHLTDPELSLTGVADHFGISTRLVGVVCKRRFGTNFLQYVRDCQIRKAAEMLRTGEASLEEISKACGFTNVLTFRRNFKTVMGVNPSDYRG